MKNPTQLKLMCQKVEIKLSIEAWYFLHGTTDGVSNSAYFLSLISKMQTTDKECSKRGQSYILHAGQLDGSMLSLSREWSIGRKAVSRLLDDFQERGIISVDSNSITTIVNMLCVKNWINDGKSIQNPLYFSFTDAYDGATIFLIDGQRLETLRKSTHKTRTNKPVVNEKESEDMPLIDMETQDNSTTVLESHRM